MKTLTFESTSTCFIRPVADRLNIITSSLTSSLIIENNTVKGLVIHIDLSTATSDRQMYIREAGINVVNAGRYRKSKSETQYYAGKEVILCGGAFNTPQLLNISGIGNAKDLKEANIECRLNSEVRVSWTTQIWNSPVHSRPTSVKPIQALVIIYKIIYNMNTWQNARNLLLPTILFGIYFLANYIVGIKTQWRRNFSVPWFRALVFVN